MRISKKALIVGINYYDHTSSLQGCVNDAGGMAKVLARNNDGGLNFEVDLFQANDASNKIGKDFLRSRIEDLFSGDPNIALLYFSGHGNITDVGGYIMASDAKSAHDGLPLNDILAYANKSQAANRVIIFDSCHSGIAGASLSAAQFSEIKEGTTILTASTAEQYAIESDNNTGVFTSLLIEALEGAAANVLGQISPGAVYAHIDQSLGSWDQRPVFKTNIKRFVSLRTARVALQQSELRRIKDLFPGRNSEFQLDPTFEPERGNADDSLPLPNADNVEVFGLLQRFNRNGLLVPVGAPHMWHAAMESKTCKLTALGEHYRQLAVRELI